MLHLYCKEKVTFFATIKEDLEAKDLQLFKIGRQLCKKDRYVVRGQTLNGKGANDA